MGLPTETFPKGRKNLSYKVGEISGKAKGMKSMKKLIWICSVVVLLLCLTACKSKDVPPTETEETEIPVETLPLDDFEILAPTEAVETTSEPEKGETLAVLEWGSYNGVFVEDGSDRSVEMVPCLLIRNTTEQYLDYGVVNATIGEKNCSFVVTGLPSGGAAWVLEETGQTMESGEAFTYVDQTVSQLRELPKEDRIEVQFLNGELQVTNHSDVGFSEIRVYYKQLHSDGNYLGGITYTTKGQALEPGQTLTLTAGHSTESSSVLVRVDCTE